MIVDVDKAAAAAPARIRRAMRRMAGLYLVKTFPVDVWLDKDNEVRRYEQVTDPAKLKLPEATRAAVSASGPISIHIELFDFGSPVEAQVPPADQVADVAQLQRLGSSARS